MCPRALPSERCVSVLFGYEWRLQEVDASWTDFADTATIKAGSQCRKDLQFPACPVLISSVPVFALWDPRRTSFVAYGRGAVGQLLIQRVFAVPALNHLVARRPERC